MFLPGWDVVKEAALWREATWQKTVLPWLTGHEAHYLTQSAGVLELQNGPVHTTSLTLNSRTEQLKWGMVGPLLEARSHMEVIYMEVVNKEVPLDDDCLGALVKCAKQAGGVRVFIWAAEPVSDAMHAEGGQMSALLGPGGCLQSYRCKKVRVYLRREAAFGDRPTGYGAVTRVVTILHRREQKVREVYPYISTTGDWSPSIMAYLLWLFPAYG
jgi:hypothetical protein